MPYVLREEEHGLFMRFWGRPDTSEIFAALSLCWEHPKRETVRYELWDCEDVVGIDAADLDALAFAYMDNANNRRLPSKKFAFITQNADLIAFLEIYRGGIDGSKIAMGIFPTEEEARRWLDE